MTDLKPAANLNDIVFKATGVSDEEVDKKIQYVKEIKARIIQEFLPDTLTGGYWYDKKEKPTKDYIRGFDDCIRIFLDRLRNE